MAAITSLLAFAHPGHGMTDPASWTHYLTEPVHVVLAAVAISAWLLVGLRWRARDRSRSGRRD